MLARTWHAGARLIMHRLTVTAGDVSGCQLGATNHQHVPGPLDEEAQYAKPESSARSGYCGDTGRLGCGTTSARTESRSASEGGDPSAEVRSRSALAETA